jgi:hypothetical protein
LGRAESGIGDSRRTDEAGGERSDTVAGGQRNGSMQDQKRIKKERRNREAKRQAERKRKALGPLTMDDIESIKYLMPNAAKVLKDYYFGSK